MKIHKPTPIKNGQVVIQRPQNPLATTFNRNACFFSPIQPATDAVPMDIEKYPSPVNVQKN